VFNVAPDKNSHTFEEVKITPDTFFIEGFVFQLRIGIMLHLSFKSIL